MSLPQQEEWMQKKLSFADLRGADLTGAQLWSAKLTDADLTDADLTDADLTDADLTGATLPPGYTWEVYLGAVMPALCQAGGKSLAEVATAWECHEWENCPMSVAFGVRDFYSIPLQYQKEVTQFIQFFDAGLIPCPK